MHVKPSDIDIGDTVLVKQNRKHTRIGSTPYNPLPFCVIRKKGNSVTAKRGEMYITRNCSFFKKLSLSQPMSDNDSIMSDYDTDTNFVAQPELNITAPDPGVSSTPDRVDCSKQIPEQPSASTPGIATDTPTASTSPQIPLRRSTRLKKPPAALKDFVHK